MNLKEIAAKKTKIDDLPTTSTASTIAKEVLGERTPLGEIKINPSVVASIVRLSVLEVEGTHSVGGSFVDGITEMFSKRESDRGVRVSEDEQGNYIIEIRVILRFGADLTKTAVQIQQNVQRQVIKMTMKQASKINVIIDGIRMGYETDQCKIQEKTPDKSTN